ncbi:ABC transporter permease [Aurantivibrio infirmus]
MSNYIFRRFVEMLVTLLLMSMVVFALGRLTGDPVALILSDYASDEDRARVVQELGLDKPIWQQYGTFLSNALRGDLGESLVGEQRPALEVVMERMPASLQLAGTALLISFLVGIPLGVLAAVNYQSSIDVIARVVALLGQSIPVFWLGIILMYLLSVRFSLLPTSGYGSYKHLILPAITMAFFTIAAVTRLVRVSMIDALGSEYVKLARIKGLSEFKVVYKHALRNSLIPVLSFMGSFFATMITGAVVVETVFSWPGIGRLAFEAILNRDFPLMQTVVLCITALFVIVNLIVDIGYAWLDPRIRFSEK